MGHIPMDGMPTFWSHGHISVFGKPLHMFSRIFLHVYSLWWVIGKKIVFWKIYEGEESQLAGWIGLWRSTFQKTKFGWEESQLKSCFLRGKRLGERS